MKYLKCSGLAAVSISLLCCALIQVLAQTASPVRDPFTPEQRKYWALQKVNRVDRPAVRHAGWARNPVDAFVLAQLEAKGLRPNPPADKITLLRRATLDLTGLPPTPEEVETF
ncbi:MAG: hypothetical protein DMG06_15955, partial [Acidobacteria bacterium]